MNKLIISAPFGNYLHWPHTTPTLGTFTREFRGGPWYRLWRVGSLAWQPGVIPCA